MKRYAVAFGQLFRRTMSIEIVEANDWKEALAQHTETDYGEVTAMSHDWLAMKQHFFQQDAMFDVIGLPEEVAVSPYADAFDMAKKMVGG